MKIKRMGISFRLTKEELYQAYLEQEHLFDMENVENEIITTDTDGDKCKDEVIQALLRDRKAISSIAKKARYEHEHNCKSYETSVEEVVSDAIDLLVEYKKRSQPEQVYV